MSWTVLGPGKMAGALIEAVKKFSPTTVPIYVRASSIESTNLRANALQVQNGWSTQKWKQADTWVLGVKPAQYRKAIEPLMPIYHARADNPPAILSLMAGVELRSLKHDFPESSIYRVMANLSIAQTQGMYGVSASGESKELETLLKCLGQVDYFTEAEMDVVTLLLGSLPAAFLKLVEASKDAGVAHGLDEQKSLKLAVSALHGAGFLMSEHNASPEAVIKRIASKGGTTEAMLEQFGALDETCQKAIKAGCDRAVKLAKVN